MSKPLPYWVVDDNLISVDFPQFKPDLKQLAAEIMAAATEDIVPEGYEPPRRKS